jgi:hypothetical protein
MEPREQESTAVLPYVEDYWTDLEEGDSPLRVETERL